MPENHKSDECSQFRRIAAKLRNLKSLIIHAKEIEQDTEVISRSLKEQYVDYRVYQVHTTIENNLAHLREIISDSNDFHIREFFINPLKCKAAVIFIENMADLEIINSHIIGKLTVASVAGRPLSPPPDDVIAYLQNTLLTAASVTEVTGMEQGVNKLLSGDTMLIVDGVASFIIVGTRKVKSRAISEPEAETSIRGSREAFTEDLSTNITLIRRRIKDPNLIVKKYFIGTRSKTEVNVVYFRGIVNPKLVCEVERRLKGVSIDSLPGSGVLQGMIEDHPNSPFPTMLPTERPDKFSSSIVEGKVGIIVDGSPFTILAPGVLTDFFQTSDDYNENWTSALLLRLLRYISALFGIITPALYIAITTFHPGLIPTPLALTISASRLGVPFPALVEAMVMEILLETLQEAGIRLPKTIGPAISIVGGLVIGDAAVRAGLVSSSIVIVTAFTAIASFNVANYRFNLLIRIFRILFMVLASSFGALGMMLGLLGVAIHLSTLESFGVSYLAPLTPKNLAQVTDLKDTVIVVSPLLMNKRPAYLEPEDNQRQDN